MKQKNLANLHLPSIENEVELIIFGGDKGISMDIYTKMQPAIKEIAALVVTHADAGMESAFRHLKYSLAEDLRSRAADMVQAHFNDLVDSTPPQEEAGEAKALDELLMLDI